MCPYHLPLILCAAFTPVARPPASLPPADTGRVAVTGGTLYYESRGNGQAVVLLGSLAGGVAVNLIYDLLGDLLKRNARGRQFHFKKIEKPDGTSIIEVRLSDDGRSGRT